MNPGAHTLKKITKIESDLMFREELKASLCLLINTFKGNENQILKKKYVEGKTLEVIAEELNYSSGYIRQKHAEVKRRIDFLDDWEAAKQKYEM